VITVIAASMTIVFLMFFMLFEGRAWVERFYAILHGIPAGIVVAVVIVYQQVIVRDLLQHRREVRLEPVGPSVPPA
jgi:hypothetical protein